MSFTIDQLKDEAMKLSPPEREKLAEELLLSIDRVESAAIDAAWLAEAHCRRIAFRKGLTSAKPVDEVIDRLLRKAAR